MTAGFVTVLNWRRSCCRSVCFSGLCTMASQSLLGVSAILSSVGRGVLFWLRLRHNHGRRMCPELRRESPLHHQDLHLPLVFLLLFLWPSWWRHLKLWIPFGPFKRFSPPCSKDRPERGETSTDPTSPRRGWWELLILFRTCCCWTEPWCRCRSRTRRWSLNSRSNLPVPVPHRKVTDVCYLLRRGTKITGITVPENFNQRSKELVDLSRRFRFGDTYSVSADTSRSASGSGPGSGRTKTSAGPSLTGSVCEETGSSDLCWDYNSQNSYRCYVAVLNSLT